MRSKKKVIELGQGEVITSESVNRWWLSPEYLSPETLKRYLDLKESRDGRSEPRRRGKARV